MSVLCASSVSAMRPHSQPHQKMLVASDSMNCQAIKNFEICASVSKVEARNWPRIIK